MKLESVFNFYNYLQMGKIRKTILFSFFILFFSGCSGRIISQAEKVDSKFEPTQASMSLSVAKQNEPILKTEDVSAETTSTPLVYPAKAEDWKLVEGYVFETSSKFLGDDYKYPKQWFAGNDGGGGSGVIIFSDSARVEHSGFLLEQYLHETKIIPENECTLAIKIYNVDPISGDEPDNYARTLLAVKKYNTKVDKNDKIVCDKTLKFMDGKIKNRVIYHKH
jgi:hypothetical protein